MKTKFGTEFQFNKEGIFIISIPAIIIAFFILKPQTPYELVIGSTLLFFITPYLITHFILKERVKFLGWQWGKKFKGFGGLLLALAVFFPILYLLAGREEIYLAYPIISSMREKISTFLLFELIVLLPAFIAVQNFIFGYIWGGFNKIWGAGKTLMLISFVIMPLIHIGKPGVEIVLAFFVGVAACWLRDRSKSVIYPILFGWGLSFVLDAIILYNIFSNKIG